MGNDLEKQYNIKQKPLKLPGSYNFLRFIHHPTQNMSLIIVKSPHRATPIPSTVILPINQVKPMGQSGDSLALCNKCLPLCLVKPRSEIEMKILMHKILKTGAQIGRCFLYSGRVMLWCEQKRGISSFSPEQLENGRCHEKSRVFIAGMALINFLYCVYEWDLAAKKEDKRKREPSTVKERVKEKLKEGSKQINESLPSEVKLFFDPKDKKEYYDGLYSIDTRLRLAPFWQAISQGLRELLLNMISQDPEKRIDLGLITNIPYFMESHQLRLYATLTEDLENMQPRESKIFMATLQLIIKEGLTIQSHTMNDFFRPVLCSMVTYNQNEGKEADRLVSLVLSILMELDKPPIETIAHGFKKSHGRNIAVSRLALSKKQKLFDIMPTDLFDSILSRSLFSLFESESAVESAISHIPFAMKNIKQANYKKQIEYQLIHRVLVYPVDKIKEALLLDALKCMIHLVRQQLITSCQKLQILIFPPQKLSIQLNFHVLYLYGLMIEHMAPQQLLEKMMPKLQLYLNDIDLYDEIFVVAKRCVDRILERLYEQRKIKPSQLVELEKDQMYFEMRPQLDELTVEEKKTIIKKEVSKHQIEQLTWAINLL